MGIIYQGIILLFVFSLASAQTSPPNPECRGMKTAARHLETGIKSISILAAQGSAKCNPNKQCSGVNCTWSSNSILEVDLRYCKDPVNYHVHFKDPGLNVDNNFNIGENDEKVLYEKRYIITIKIKVTKLRRSQNTVATSVVLVVCTPPGCKRTTLLPQQTFCVRMDKCPGFNASINHNMSCTYKSPQTTFHTSRHSTVPKTENLFSFRSSSLGPRTGYWSDSHSSGRDPTPAPDPSAKGSVDYSKKDHKDKSSKNLSTGAIIGICVAGLFVILVVVGAAVYWKKCHHRTRLRAAYYNDISMHDPLCEDFGPEVA